MKKIALLIPALLVGAFAFSQSTAAQEALPVNTDITLWKVSKEDSTKKAVMDSVTSALNSKGIEQVHFSLDVLSGNVVGQMQITGNISGAKVGDQRIIAGALLTRLS